MKKPRRSSSDSKKEMELPREIMFEILKELPVKSLLRLRCVSMLWLSVIDDPFFVELHRTRSQSRPGGIRLLVPKLQEYAYPSKYSIHSVDLDGGSKSVCLTTDEFPIRYSSNNGLVCLEKQHRLWNPSTRECIDLPPLPTDSANICRQQQYLFPVFDLSTKIYKVLSACETRSLSSNVRIDFRILSLGTSTSTSTSWREIDFMNIMWIAATCCVNNVIYFCFRPCTNVWSSKHVIVAFDVATEKFSAAFLCPSGEELRRILYMDMVQVGEKLAVVTLEVGGSAIATCIWILEDYEEDGKVNLNLEGVCIKEANWKNMVSLNFPSDWGIGLPKGGSIILTPIGKFHTSKVLFQLKHSADGTIWFYFYYDPESKTCGNLSKIEDFEIHHPVDLFLTTYVETLHRLKL